MSDEDNCSDFFVPYSGGGTSEDAAASMRMIAGELRRKVYSYIRSKGSYGATDQEIQMGLSLDSNTARPRRWELCREGKIRRSGQTRKTVSGREADVWVIKDDRSEHTEVEGMRGIAAGDVLPDGKSEVPEGGVASGPGN